MPRAQCLCGEVAYEADPPLQFPHDCHCSRCRKSHGVGSVTMAAVPLANFRWLRGEERIQRYKSSEGFTRSFCGQCGSQVPGGDDFNGITFFPIGPMEGDFEASSDGHIFVGSKAPWNDITDGLPAFEAYPPGIENPVLENLPRTASTPGRVGSSCLCGALGWEYEGKATLMRRCHCMRCRRARAASYADNGLVSSAALHWTAGEKEAVAYKLPEAERFTQSFCGTCGSKAPWYLELRDAWVIPLGALDDDPGQKPSEHIFVGSKAPYVEITDDLPQYEDWPPA